MFGPGDGQELLPPAAFRTPVLLCTPRSRVPGWPLTGRLLRVTLELAARGELALRG